MGMTTSWPQRILELEQTGLSLTQIAARVGVAKSTISEIKSGATRAPNGDAAVALYKLHKRRCQVQSASRRPSAVEGEAAEATPALLKAAGQGR